MSFDTLKRPALGQSAALGTLYDVRTDKFLPSSILRGLSPAGAVITSDNHKSHINVSSDDSYKEKFADMGMSSDLTASFLAGFVNVRSSGRYLAETHNTHTSVQRHLHYTIETVHESLNFASGGIREYVDFSGIASGHASTHVVSEISWGAQSIVSAERQLSEDEEEHSAVAQLESIFRKFEDVTVPDSIDNERRPTEPDALDSLSYLVYSDIAAPDDRKYDDERIFDDIDSATGLAVDKPTPQDFKSVYRYLKQMPKHVEAHNNGKGVPITYTLLPIKFFAVFFAVPIPPSSPIKQVSTELQERYIGILDAQRSALKTLNNHYDKLETHRFCISNTDLDAVSDRIRSTKKAEERLRSEYAGCLKNIRSGQGDTQRLSKLCDAFLRSEYSPEKLIALSSKHAEKLKFVKLVQDRGAKYLGYGGLSTEAAIRTSPIGDAFMFHFNGETMKQGESWKANETLLLETLDRHNSTTPVWVVDGDAKGLTLEKPYMSHIDNGKVVIEDVLESRKLVADKCIMKYNETALDPTAITLPSQRRLMTVPCPGVQCDPHTPCHWICWKCHMAPEYGKVDEYIYCDCGRVPFYCWSFKCKDLVHGESFVNYSERDLLKRLEHLKSRTELNVLILGETGVGKSTFVNAFVNYLAFPSLDEGMLVDELNCIVPCSFSTQEVDATGRLVKKHIKFGNDRDERDGTTGQSATRKTMVYPLYVGDYMVRLIDTPGIGDTDGVEQDKKNFVDVLSVLRNYEKLHGILILLKPNAARLTVMFRFCVEELLTHLHRSAAANMVFGFTNTRGSNYQPGDTFDPLETHLSKYKDVIPGLFRDNVYCFDSESFRYLAARKKGVDMGNLEDYRRSWDHSATEAQRLLQHFGNLNPHHVRSTLSLNETRYLIEQLTAPMAQMSKTITKNIAMNEEDAKALSDTRLTGQALLAKLNSQKLTLTAHQLSKPKTACSNERCVKFHRGTDSPGDDMQILYTTLCHNPCCLTDVPPNSIGTKELKHCAAFSGNREKCKLCTHGWQEHLHIVVEYTEKSETVTNPDVQRALTQNGNVVQAKEAAIQAKKDLIQELHAEHAQIQEAQARFTIYLRSISITPYNDATLEYYDHLIKEEKSKVGFGAPPARLNGLRRDRHRYAEFVEAMTKGLERGNAFYQPLDEDGVYQLVEKLYNLKHNGNDLRKIAKVVGMAYAATFREKVYRIKGRNYRPVNPCGGRSERHALLVPIRENTQRAVHIPQEPSQPLHTLRNKLQRRPREQNTPSRHSSQVQSSHDQIQQSQPGYETNRPIHNRLLGLDPQPPPQSTYLRNTPHPSSPENCLSSPPPYEAQPTVIRPSAARYSAVESNNDKKSGWLKNKVNKMRGRSGD